MFGVGGVWEVWGEGCQPGGQAGSIQQGVGHPGPTGSTHAPGFQPAQQGAEGGGEFGKRGDERMGVRRVEKMDGRRDVMGAGKSGVMGARMERPSHWLEICRGKSQGGRCEQKCCLEQ